MKKSFLVLLSIVMLFSVALTACGGSETSGGGDQVFRANLHSEPPTLDPGKASDSTSGTIIRAVFEGLTRINKDTGKPEKAMAADIQASDDLMSYTFTLRDDVTWTNGDPVTAHDFEYAWKRVLDPEFEADYAYQLYILKNAAEAKKGEVSLDEVGVKAVDDKTLEVELAAPAPYFLELTAFYTYMPVNKNVVSENDAWANDAGEAYVTNGAFKLDVWEHSNTVELVKNDDYWDKDVVKLNKIIFTMVEDENTELSMFESGEIDWAGAPFSSLPTDSIPVLAESGDLITQPIAGTYWYKLNTEKAPFDNVKMRKAFAYAIDRQAIVDNVTQGGQLPAMAAVPPTMGLNEGGYFKDADVETAKQLFNEALEEMGLASANELPPITLSYNTSDAHAKIAQAIQDQWKKAFGIEVGLENSEWKVYIEKLHAGDYQIGRMGWLGDFNDPINFLELYKEKGGNNDTRWTSEEFASLLNQSMTETDADKRTAMLQQAEQIMMDEMPVIPIYFYTFNWVKADYVKDIYVDGLGSVDMKWAYIEK